MNAYPNPFKDEINVGLLLPVNTITAKLQLIEVATGRIIDEQNANSKQNLYKFNTSQLANGVYLIAIKGDNMSPSFVKVINLK
ncbi:MAG: T9SS type A sorting domain-containing protein [Bacteroidetes bacterium]|nr:T9SS type A sorting domain-containing protein [Bacteroidota bacterium]